MKKIVLASLMMVCLPYLAMAQSVDDDLYFIPKKKADKKEEVKQEVKVVVPQKRNTTTVYAAPGSTVVVKDVKGNMRDVDEYNRRYTSRENNFSMENDTLYIEEKPLNERGEWVNGFEGSQNDYEYAMRIVRFRNPRYAIPVSSPLYWDVVYGAYPSWDWNVYDDGLYAYVFPTYTNRLWWDWRFNYPYGGGWGMSWGWSSPWYYNSWYGPGYWGGGYWGWHHHNHYYPHYGWGGGHWHGHGGWGSRPRGYSDYRAGNYNGGIRPSTSNGHRGSAIGRGNSTGGRYNSGTNSGRISRGSYVRNNGQAYRNRNTTTGRVINSSTNVGTSIRPNNSGTRYDRGTSGNRGGTIGINRGEVRRPAGTYTRPKAYTGSRSSYSRPSSTRSSVSNTSRYNNSNNSSRGTYRNSNSSSYNRSNSSTGSSRSSSSYSSGGGSSRSSGGSVGGGGGAGRRR